MKKERKKKTYNPQTMEWGTPASTAWAKSVTPGQVMGVDEGVDIEKEYGKVFHLSVKQVAAQKKTVNKLKAKWDAVEKSLGYDASKDGINPGKNISGLTPEHIRTDPKWRAAESAWRVAFKKEQQMNQKMSKVFKKEMRDLRNKDRMAYRDLYTTEGRTLETFKSHFNNSINKNR